MPTALIGRSIVAATYLVALAVNGTLTDAAGLPALALVLLWSAPLLRQRARRQAGQRVRTGRPRRTPAAAA